MPAQKLSRSFANASRQLWPHIWTQPCLAKRRHMSFLSVSRLPFLSLNLSIYPPIYLSIYLPTYLPTYLSIYLSMYLSMSLPRSVHLSLYITPQIGGVGGTRALAHSIDIIVCPGTRMEQFVQQSADLFCFSSLCKTAQGDGRYALA